MEEVGAAIKLKRVDGHIGGRQHGRPVCVSQVDSDSQTEFGVLVSELVREVGDVGGCVVRITRDGVVESGVRNQWETHAVFGNCEGMHELSHGRDVSCGERV